MKVKFGAFVTDGRNKAGGTVFSRNRGGAYARNLVTPVNPQSPLQMAVRAQFGALSQAWRNLTAGQRKSWNDIVGRFARTDIFGDLRNPSGSNLHLRVNRNLQTINQPIITAPIPPIAGLAFDTFSLTANTTLGTLNFAFTPVIPAGTSVIIRATPPLSPGVNFVKSEFRVLQILTVADLTPVDLAAAYIALFGVLPPIGEKVFIEAVPVLDNSGVNSAGIKLDDIAV